MRDLLIALIVFGSVPFILRRPYIGVLMWAWISYMNPHRFTYEWAFSYPFAQIVAIATFAGMFMSSEPKRIHWNAATVTWLLFIVWMSLTTLFALNPTDAWPEWERAMKIQLISFVTLILITNRERLYLLIWVIVISLGFFGVKGGLFTLLSGGHYRIYGPPESFVTDNNTLALALIMTLPLMRYVQMESASRLVRIGLLVAMGITGLCILASNSRGALLAGGAMLALLWLKSPKKLGGALIIAMAIPTLLAMMPESWYERMSTIKTYEEDASAMGRLNAWEFAYNVARDRPLVGGGYNTFTPTLFQRYAPLPDDFHDAHSIYFEVLGEHGFVGIALFLALGFLAFRLGTWTIRHTRDRPDLVWARNLAAMLQVSLVGYAVGGAFLGLAYYDLVYHVVGGLIITKHIVENALSEPQPIVATQTVAAPTDQSSA